MKDQLSLLVVILYIKMLLRNVATCFLIIVVTCVITGESVICDICTCENSVINCTNNGSFKTLDLSDHAKVVKNATYIHFDNENIEYVKKLPPSEVKFLSLRHNKISKIDTSAFQNLKSLVGLDLSYNCLTIESLLPNIFDISKDDSSKSWSLAQLRLDYNDIHSLPQNIFLSLGNLDLLTLTGNPLKVIDRPTSYALASLPMLRVLNLSNTSLHELPERILHTPRYLKTLNLSNNKFTRLPQGLAEVHELIRLDFSNNPIQNISDFPKMSSLKILHLSHMPELNTIGPHAFSLLNNLEEFYCSYNHKLKSIHPSAFSYTYLNGQGKSWPNIIKLDLSYNDLEYLDSNLLGRWDTLKELNLQGNKWICDCVNQWFVSVLAPMVESRHPEFLKDFICQEPVEMNGISIFDLNRRHYHNLRCLDVYNNRPERDGILLVGILIGVILAVPFAMGFMMCCAKRKNSLSYYHRIFNHKTSHPHDFQLRETSIYQPTSIIADGY